MMLFFLLFFPFLACCCDAFSVRSKCRVVSPSLLRAKTSGGRYFKVVSSENETVDAFGHSTWCDIKVDDSYVEEKLPSLEQSSRLSELGPCSEERVFCSRTLNLRAVKVVGYDMDYTVVHYKWLKWEAEAYDCAKNVLLGYGFPVEDLTFDDADLVCRGLVVDKDRGNFLKIDRHGFVRRAMHGTKRLSEKEIDVYYGRRTVVDLREKNKYLFLNTLFSVSEGVLYSQLVTKLDSGALFREARPPFDNAQCQSYADLHRAVSKALQRAHTHQSSRLKEVVSKNPEAFTQRDPEKLRATLRDQRSAGKKLALITNSGFRYSDIMMTFVLNDANWRSYFDVVFVSARKPSFFTTQPLPCYELMIDDDAATVERTDPLLRETTSAREGGLYCGGSARFVEKLFNVSANDVLYVGDHVFVDANAVKATMRWRTALVVQELESEIVALNKERNERHRLEHLKLKKSQLQTTLNELRCHLRRYEDRTRHHKDSFSSVAAPLVVFDDDSADLCRRHMANIVRALEKLDDDIIPAVRTEGHSFNRYWGFISRAGYDKSSFQRQIEKYADIYTAKVTNLLPYTPYHEFQAFQAPLAHEPDDDSCGVDSDGSDCYFEENDVIATTRFGP